MALAKRRMQQVELPFDAQFSPGWTGRRYLKCSDGLWHLVMAIYEDRVADTQCCADVTIADSPTIGAGACPMCMTCADLQFPDAKKKGER